MVWTLTSSKLLQEMFSEQLDDCHYPAIFCMNSVLAKTFTGSGHQTHHNDNTQMISIRMLRYQLSSSSPFINYPRKPFSSPTQSIPYFTPLPLHPPLPVTNNPSYNACDCDTYCHSGCVSATTLNRSVLSNFIYRQRVLTRQSTWSTCVWVVWDMYVNACECV